MSEGRGSHKTLKYFILSSAVMGMSLQGADERTGQNIGVEWLGNCTAIMAAKQAEILLLIRILKLCWTVSVGLV